MTKKYYETVAEILRRAMVRANTLPSREAQDILRHLAEDFCTLFQSGNPRFDRMKFLHAAGLWKYPEPLPLPPAKGGD